MLRWIATVVIASLLALTVWIPDTPLGRRGTENAARSDIASAVASVGKPMPDFEAVDFDGRRFRLSELRGKRVLLTFERSVDW